MVTKILFYLLIEISIRISNIKHCRIKRKTNRSIGHSNKLLFIFSYTLNPIIISIFIIQMAVVADVTAQSFSGENDPNKNSSIIPSSTNKKSHIREHPFMKEVKFLLSSISIIHFTSFSLLQVV